MRNLEGSATRDQSPLLDHSGAGGQSINDTSLAGLPSRGRLNLAAGTSKDWAELSWDGGLVRLSRGLEIYSFDLCGRPFSITLKNFIYRRGLDGKIVRIHRYMEGGEKFHASYHLSEEEKQVFLESVRQAIYELKPRIGQEFRLLEPVFSIDLKKDALNFKELYGEVGILPPDCYRSLLLNLTIGCSYNKCSFCNFYKDKIFRLRTPEQFKEHIAQAKSAFGPSIASRKGIFLGQANAANAPLESLEYALHLIASEFQAKFLDSCGNKRHLLGFERVSAFMDTFSRVQRSASDWKKLYDLGLKALYLGVESGSPEVLKLLQKPGHPRYIKETAITLKKIGFELNVIFMTGAGGQELANSHLQQSAELINELPLAAGDRIYISPFVPHPNSEYVSRAKKRNLTALSELECRKQTHDLRKLLRIDPYPQGPATTFYDIKQFIY